MSKEKLDQVGVNVSEVEQSYFPKFYTEATVKEYQQNREMFKDFLGNNQLYKTIEHNLCMKIYQQYHEAA